MNWKAKAKLKARTTEWENKLKRRAKHKKLRGKSKLKPPVEFYKTSFWKVIKFSMYDIFDHICMKCGCTNHRKIQIDHVYPRALHPDKKLDILNMQVLCSDCNKQKLNTIVDYRDDDDILSIIDYIKLNPDIKTIGKRFDRKFKGRDLMEDLDYKAAMNAEDCKAKRLAAAKAYKETKLKREGKYVDPDLEAKRAARPKTILRKRNTTSS